MRNVKRRAAVIVAAAGIGLGGIAACTGAEDAETSTPPPANSEPAEPKSKEPAEAKDVTRLELVDHSRAGFTDVRVEYEVTNKSSKKSDYEITYEVINKQTDKRVWDSILLETGVAPGQTTTGEDFINIKEGTTADQYEVNLTDVNRSEAF